MNKTVHWFECLMSHLEIMEEEKRKFVLSLIDKPLDISDSDIKKYIPGVLGRKLFLLRKYISYSLANKKHLFTKGVKSIGCKTYILDNGEEKLIDNAKIIENEYRERIKDDLVKNNLPLWHQLSYQDKCNLYAFYAFSEFVSYILLGIIEYDSNYEGCKKYKLNKELLKSYKMIWFARYFTKQSHFSDVIFRNEIGRKVIHRDSYLFQNFVDIVLDKYISFHPLYTKFLDSADNVIFSDIRRLAEIVSFFSLQHDIKDINNTQPIISRDKLYEFGFSEDEIKYLFKKLDDFEVHENDRIVTELDNKLIRLNNINLKFAIKTISSKYLTNMNKIGSWFEGDYLLEYLKNKLDSNRFIVTNGINDPKEKYDADIIIYDESSNLIYFCQIKHRIATIHPFFKDEFNEYCRNESLNHGIDQLCSLRSKALTDKVKERLISRLGKKIVNKLDMAKNCRFILIHSIENLDMCTKNGISMYEWNTFRNILQGKFSSFKVLPKDANLNCIYYSNKLLDFSDIVSVQDYLIKNLQKIYDDSLSTNLGPAEEWEILNGARALFMFNTSISCMNRPFFTSKWISWEIPLII